MMAAKAARWRARLRAVEAAAAGLPGEEPWRGEVMRRGMALQAALRGAARGEMLAVAAALVGVGEGSTPAGDDYLVGVIHALRLLWHEGEGGPGPASPLLATMPALAAGRTTAASAAWLAAAARGDASPRWAALLTALGGDDDAAVAVAAAAVRATGHTSGAFSLRGFLDTVAP